MPQTRDVSILVGYQQFHGRPALPASWSDRPGGSGSRSTLRKTAIIPSSSTRSRAPYDILDERDRQITRRAQVCCRAGTTSNHQWRESPRPTKRHGIHEIGSSPTPTPLPGVITRCGPAPTAPNRTGIGVQESEPRNHPFPKIAKAQVD